jgi:RNA polymerase sigma factor (sigma-70 family)
VDPQDPERRFEALYGMHYTAVEAYVRRRTDTADDAADAIAETFLTAWRRLAATPEGDAARLWLYGVARRVLANQRRGAARRTALADRLRAELAVRAVPATAGDPQTSAVREALRKLSAADRELLTLIGWEGLTPAEAAVVLGSSRTAVRVRLHRARKRLAQHLDPAADGTRIPLLAEGRS